MKRLLSAKSMRRRIRRLGVPWWRLAGNYCSTVFCRTRALRDDLVAGFDAGDYFLHVVGEHFSGDDCDALEFISARGHVDPIAIVQVEDRRSGHGGVRFFLLAAESGGDEHAGAHVAGIVDFDANFGGANIGIEDGADVADACR